MACQTIKQAIESLEGLIADKDWDVQVDVEHSERYGRWKVITNPIPTANYITAKMSDDITFLNSFREEYPSVLFRMLTEYYEHND